MAECARAALAGLRILRAHKDHAGTPLSLEQAGLVLVGRLINLGLCDLAVKELRILKARLLCLSGERRDAKERESLADLLCFEGSKLDGPLLSLAIGFQTHVLKVIAFKKRPETVQAALAHLKLDCPTSPANLIKASSQGPAAPKAAIQLQNLVQLLRSLSPPVMASEDDVATDRSTSLSPRSSLRVHVMSFEVQCWWWTLANHVPNPDKELWQPLARCLQAFHRREKKHTASDLDYLQAGLERLKDSTHTKRTPDCISTVLGQIAHNAGLKMRALDLGLEALSIDGSLKASPAKICSQYCAISTMRLDMPTADTLADCNQSLSDATMRLKADLKGDPSELDHLLAEANRLKSAAMRGYLLQSNAFGDAQDMTEAVMNLQKQCVNYIHAFARFLVRYVGKDPTGGDIQRAETRHHHCISKVAGVFKSSVDSIVVVARRSLETVPTTWEASEAAVQDCALLAGKITRSSVQDKSFSSYPANQSPYVRLSNVYWLHYQTQIRNEDCGAETVKSLRRSIEILGDRPLLEQTAGFIGLKLEKLAQLYGDLKRSADSKRTCQEALNKYIECGVLRSVAATSAFQPQHAAWLQKAEHLALSRVLRTLMSASLSKTQEPITPDILFEGDGLPAPEHGVLLSHQLDILFDLLGSRKSSHNLRILQQTIQRLLAICKTAYPVRHVMVVLTVLRFSGDHADAFESDFIGMLIDEIHGWANTTPDLGEDIGLSSYCDYFASIRQLLLVFRESDPSIGAIEDVLETWERLLDKADSEPALLCMIDSIDSWLSFLRSISGFLNLHAEHFLEIKVQNLMSNIEHLCARGTSTSKLLSDVALAEQCLHLGHSTKAGLYLASARNHLDSSDLSSTAVIQWHLTNTHYMAAIGNVDDCMESLAAARELYEINSVANATRNKCNTTLQSISDDRFMGAMAHACSVAARERGLIEDALMFAKQSNSLYGRAWALCVKLTKRQSADSGDSSTDVLSLTEGVSKLDLSCCDTSIQDASSPTPRASNQSRLQGALFWPHVASYHATLLDLSDLYAHLGLLENATYYAKMSAKLAGAVPSKHFQAQSNTTLARLEARQGRFEKSQHLLDESLDLTVNRPHLVQLAEIHSVSASASQGRNDFKGQIVSLDKAKKHLEKASSAIALDGRPFDKDIDDLNHHVARLQINKEPPPNRNPKTREGPLKPTRAPIKKPATRTEPPKPVTKAEKHDCIPLERMLSEIYRHKADAMLASDEIEDAGHVLDEAAALPCTVDGSVLQAISAANKFLRRAMRCMSSHAVYSVLHESTIAFPSIVGSPTTNEGKSLTCSSQKTSAVPTTQKKTAVRRNGSRKAAEEDGLEYLLEARDVIMGIHTLAIKTASTASLHSLSKLLDKITMLISATDARKGSTAISSLHMAYGKGMQT